MASNKVTVGEFGLLMLQLIIPEQLTTIQSPFSLASVRERAVRGQRSLQEARGSLLIHTVHLKILVHGSRPQSGDEEKS